jgi:hypothetical protein
MRKMLLVGALLAAVGAMGYKAGAYQRHHPTTKLYTQVRGNFVRTALENAEPVDTLVLGDSILEMTPLFDVCGRTFNASVAGARIENVAALAPFAIQRTRPKVIVVEVGANHFFTDADLAGFERQYAALLRSLPGRKILVGVPNSAEASGFVRAAASEIGAAYVEPVTPGKLTRNGGVHPTPIGADVYRQRIRLACSGKA